MNTPSRYQARLARRFAETPDRLFCRQIGDTGARELTWGDLEADCGRFAAAYRQAGLCSGDQALIFLRHVPDLYGAFFGAMLAAVTPSYMPCSSPRQDADLYWRSHQTLLRVIAPAAIVTDRNTLAEMAAADLELGAARVILIEDTAPAALSITPADEAAIALLQHSSGTTGLKKGVALSHAAITAQVESYGRAIELTERDTIVSWLPLYHDMGLIACLILPAFHGAPIVHLDAFHWIARPAGLFDEMARCGPALTWLPNFAFEHLAATCGRRAGDWDLSAARAFIDCSEPCKPASFDRFAAAFAPAGVRQDQLHCCYAMAETVFAASQTPLAAGAPRRFVAQAATLERGRTPAPAAEGPGGVALLETGPPIDGIDVTILEETGEPAPPGAVGEIGLSGPFLFTGYNGDPVLTAERLKDGVYRSRDLGFMRDGRLYVLGRLDDLIIVNGRNLYAHEVEASVSRVAGVKSGRVAAVPWFDERVGSQTLVVMAEATVAEADHPRVRRAVIERVQAEFNVVPRAVDLLGPGALIKTSSGKVSRKENLARYAARLETARAGLSQAGKRE